MPSKKEENYKKKKIFVAAVIVIALILFFFFLFSDNKGSVTLPLTDLPARKFWIDSKDATRFTLSGSNVTRITDSIASRTTGSITGFTYDSVNNFLVSSTTSVGFAIGAVVGDYSISVLIKCGARVGFGYIFGLFLQ